MNAIEVDGLSFSYPDGAPALKDIRFVVGAGECIGIIGPNGAGKSTLLLHLNGILPERIGGNSPVRIFGNTLMLKHGLERPHILRHRHPHQVAV